MKIKRHERIFHMSGEERTAFDISRTRLDEVVEDERTTISSKGLKSSFARNLHYNLGVSPILASVHDCYLALAQSVREQLMERWISTIERYFNSDNRAVYYLSAEFLMGRQLGNNLINTGLFNQTAKAVRELGLDLFDLMEEEPDPGLGNGGLGRLAACYLDSLATLDIPAMGYGIRYEFGIFKQEIREGWQFERPDKWLQFGNPWEVARPQLSFPVFFGGHVSGTVDESGIYRPIWIPERTVLGTPYDTLVPGYQTQTVNTLRLWCAKASKDFDFEVFNAGDYTKAVEDKTFSENISKVLYPNDNTREGKELRLRQQYFFASCSLQDIIRTYLLKHQDLTKLHEKIVIQLNDTHPAIAVAELMRLLVDIHHLDWKVAWDVTEKCFAFTNHTLLPEALEKWPVSMFGKILPRPLEIIYQINQNFVDILYKLFPDDEDRIKRMSIVEEGMDKQVRMANLATVGSFAVNGVAPLHSDLVKNRLLNDFYRLWPNKFSNKTNGVTPRRWILLSNPKLTYLICEKIGKSWLKNLDDLRYLEEHIDDVTFRDTWQAFKESNKEDLANYILHVNKIRVPSESIFDVQVKRIHEYKRQLLNALHIVHLYLSLKDNPNQDFTPRTFIFSGKAAPGYFMAKLIIKLINSIADVVNSDEKMASLIRVVFMENFSVTLGEKIYPAADISEQISLAGKEASGTGNMKFALNGALTVGTLDGANIQIRDAVGEDNFYLFGLTIEEVEELSRMGYRPWEYYQKDSNLRRVLDALGSGLFSRGDQDLFKPIIQNLLSHDEYMHLADFDSYVKCQERIGQDYLDSETWIKKSIINVARCGYFSSDRSVQEYCQDIWRAEPFAIDNSYVPNFTPIIPDNFFESKRKNQKK
jgi:glycogen phosphorylase